MPTSDVAGSLRRAVGALSLVLVAIGCGSAPEAAEWEFVTEDTTNWVSIYDPERAFNGYTLTRYPPRIPILLDMNGRIVHAWPDVRIWTRAILLPDGGLLAFSSTRGVVEYDWDGNERWRYNPPRGLAHHDVRRLDNGNTLLMVQVRSEVDDVLEVDPAGEIVWQWKARERMKDWLPVEGAHDPIHLNSVQSLPENQWFDAGDERFRPGNLLLSARNLNLAFIVDRETGDIVWQWTERLDMQHEALMLPEGQPGAGNIQILNNRYRSFQEDRRSEVLEIQPVSGEIVWSYTDETFFTPTAGLSQSLPNGNVLVASSRGGRVFEVTPEGETVWQWTPPYLPRRPSRYAPDYAPQLADLKPLPIQAVSPPDGYRFVDLPVYRVARRIAHRGVMVRGEKVKAMKSNSFCGEVLLPGGPSLKTGYTLDRRRMRSAGVQERRVRFAMTWTVDDETETLFEETLEPSDEWREREVPMDRWAQQRGLLCLETTVVGGTKAETETESFAIWSVPAFVSGYSRALDTPEETLTAEEAEAQRQHLEALGYVE